MGKPGIFRKIKLFFLKLARARASTYEISLGAAIGTFISVFPTFGLGMPLVALLGRFIKFNVVVALAFSVISNPFTSPFFILMSYKVGSVITGSQIDLNAENWKSNLSETGLAVLLGTLIVSGVTAVLAFYISKIIVTNIRKNRGRVKGLRERTTTTT